MTLQEKGGTASSDPPAHLRSVLETVGLVIAPTTLLTSVLFFFGYMRSKALWDRFGLDLSVMGFSTQDYLLRGIDGVWWPLSAVVLAALLLLRVHSHVLRSLAAGRRLGRIATTARVIEALGAASFVLGLGGLLWRGGSHFLFTPLSSGVGIAAMAYARHLLRKMEHASRPKGVDDPEPQWINRGYLMLVAMFLILSLFWATAEWAGAVGTGRAEHLIQNLNNELPGVTVYTQKRLNVEISTVKMADLGGNESDYRFRYTGLRLLIKANGKYFLVPEDWKEDNPFTLLIPDEKDMRIEFSP
jgi:hypothetical protein